MPPSWEGYRNDYALEAAQKYPDRFAVMGKVPLNDPASKNRIASWLKQPGMLGFRISFRHSGTHSFLDDGTADWFWADCERYDIPVMIFAPFAVAKIGEIAERHPGLRVIVDHMGLNVQWKGKDLGPGIDVLLKFARMNNVGVKASCLPCYVAEPYPFPHCIRRSVALSTPSVRKEFSGAPICRRCPAATVKPSHCSPKSSIFFPRRTKSGSWAELSRTGCAGRWLNKQEALATTK